MVNTFMPFADFAMTAHVLHMKHLGKQRVETMQIMSAIVMGTFFAQNHPATNMWRGHEWALMEYQKAICYEWVTIRGYKDTCLEKTQDLYDLKYRKGDEGRYPWWLSNSAVTEGYKSKLMFKKPQHYGRYFGRDFPQDLPYIWPTAEEPQIDLQHPALSEGSVSA